MAPIDDDRQNDENENETISERLYRARQRREAEAVHGGTP